MSEVGPQDTSMANWPAVVVLPGARECVSELYGKATLCIATNAIISHERDIRRALDRGNLGQFFDRIFCFMDLGFKKSQPEFWHAVEQALRIPLRQIAMVGDSLEQDAQAPKSFGVQSVWLAPNEFSDAAEPDVLRVTRLEEFAQMVVNAA
jgi:aminoglycoside 6'-N-acetyltransferase I